MSFYHVYARAPGDPRPERMQLRAATGSFDRAEACASALFRNQPPDPDIRVAAPAPAGIVTGLPIWVRNKPGGGPVVMITCHASAATAAAEEDTLRKTMFEAALSVAEDMTKAAEAAAQDPPAA